MTVAGSTAIGALQPDGRLRERPVGDRFLSWFVLVLYGYAVGSRGFAYLGYPPLFVGEVVLAGGLIALYVGGNTRAVLRQPIAWALLAFMGWSAFRTVPFLQEYGVNALRDAAFWGYGLFAIIVAGLVLARPARLGTLLLQYRRFCSSFLIAAPVLWLVTIALGSAGPKWPGSGMPMLHAKGTDFLVHFSGIVAFFSLGLAGTVAGWKSVLLTVAVILTGFKSRGGLLAFLVAYVTVFFYRPRNRTSWRMASLGVSAAVLLGVTGIAIRFPGIEREISFSQFAEHFASAAGSSNEADLENTKEWRLAWWASIVSYTFGGEYFWNGKGYGVNLADDDGFQVSEDHSLRSPHNVHMTVLARSGVPGLCAWVLLQVLWGMSVLRTALRATRAGQRQWSAVLVFLLAYWLAILINGTFDVYLEGPMGGIWYWTIFGLGVAVVSIVREQLDDPTTSALPSNERIHPARALTPDQGPERTLQ